MKKINTSKHKRGIFIKEIRHMSLEDLLNKLISLKRELFSLRFQKTLKEITDTSVFKTVRKNIARVKTELYSNRIQQQVRVNNNFE